MTNKRKIKPETTDEEEVKVSGVLLLKVQALSNHSNGMLEEAIRHWSRGEIKEITLAQYRRLLADNPSNWSVLHG